MSIAHLDDQQAFAFIEEMTSTRNLLAYGTRVIRTAAFLDTTRDPILTMLSIGVEKLYKLTLGLSALDANQSWPTKGEMRAFGHNLADMHTYVMADLSNRTATGTEYVRGLLADVQTDGAVIPLIATLGRYGQSGRFYHLDRLGDAPQPWDSPEDYWQRIEDAVTDEPEIAAAYAAAMNDSSNNVLWDQLYSSINQRIADTVERLWTMVAVCGRNHALGEAGTIFGFDIHPNAVGRQ
ncbi:hypothetical protein ACU18_15410 [Arthrobacter sp. ZBG10]|uniref:hypothetical protein n=1 Tax=Arthrobacter sp. ZBG10 TaxID=1676590 RepID=UPI00068035B1|nr:hypothetical protein [Arthrobacter sp. ZBG10]KNH15989.1 hypothetical protein ACU18_15410 [Arthrobacter sp. ZBG10]